MAGNVREWVWNEEQPGQTRYILGGGWSDPVYQFQHADARSPFDRSEENGFRLVQYSANQPPAEAFTEPVRGSSRDYSEEEAASDEVFDVYRSLYSYDPTPLDDRVESIDESELWRREVVSFNASYSDERVVVHLFLPKNAQPPFQAVLHFPGAGAITTPSSEDMWIENRDITESCV